VRHSACGHRGVPAAAADMAGASPELAEGMAMPHATWHGHLARERAWPGGHGKSLRPGRFRNAAAQPRPRGRVAKLPLCSSPTRWPQGCSADLKVGTRTGSELPVCSDEVRAVQRSSTAPLGGKHPHPLGRTADRRYGEVSGDPRGGPGVEVVRHPGRGHRSVPAAAAEMARACPEIAEGMAMPHATWHGHLARERARPGGHGKSLRQGRIRVAAAQTRT